MTSDAYNPSPLRAFDIFECCQCGECCKGYGGTFVADSDILAIADFVGVSADDFIGEYCSPSGSGRVLTQGKDGYCIFAERGKCAIHPVKPKMCRDWPFIEGVLRDPGNWYIMAGFCPGMRTDVSESVIRECVKAVIGVFKEKAPEKMRKRPA